MTNYTFTAIVTNECGGYASLCIEFDVAGQGSTVELATASLKEAVELFLECADPEEIARRSHGQVFITSFEASDWGVTEP